MNKQFTDEKDLNAQYTQNILTLSGNQRNAY